MGVVTVPSAPGAFLWNLGRSPKAAFTDKLFGNGNTICPAKSPAGELADCVVFGFVQKSHLVDGRTYKTVDGGKRVLKELSFYPITQEWERTKAVASGIFKGKICSLQVNDAGAISASTKHTAVDENGEPEQKSALQIYLPSVTFD